MKFIKIQLLLLRQAFTFLKSGSRLFKMMTIVVGAVINLSLDCFFLSYLLLIIYFLNILILNVLSNKYIYLGNI